MGTKKNTSKFLKERMGQTREDMCKNCQKNPEATIDEETEILFEQEKDRHDNLLKRQKYLNERLMRAKGKQNRLAKILMQYQEALTDEGMSHVLTKSNFHVQVHQDGPVYNFGKLYAQKAAGFIKENEHNTEEEIKIEDYDTGSGQVAIGSKIENQKINKFKEETRNKKSRKNMIKKVKRSKKNLQNTGNSLRNTGTEKSIKRLRKTQEIESNLKNTDAFKKKRKRSGNANKKSARRKRKPQDKSKEINKPNKTGKLKKVKPKIEKSQEIKKEEQKIDPTRKNEIVRDLKQSKRISKRNEKSKTRRGMTAVSSNKQIHQIKSQKILRQNQSTTGIPKNNSGQSNSSKRLAIEKSQDKLAKARMKHKSRVSSVFADEKKPKTTFSRNLSRRALSRNQEGPSFSFLFKIILVFSNLRK